MTREEFRGVFAVLAVQLHAVDADQATMEAYLAALSDLDIELVEAAASRLAWATDENGKTWFPKAPEWRREVAKVEAEWKEKQRALLRKLPEPLCARCRDTQWKRMSNGRVAPCECRKLRRLEMLGRALPPALTERKELVQ